MPFYYINDTDRTIILASLSSYGRKIKKRIEVLQKIDCKTTVASNTASDRIKNLKITLSKSNELINKIENA